MRSKRMLVAELPLAAQKEIDAVCDSFERQWQSGATPSIEQFVADADTLLREALFAELLPLDIGYRHRSGEVVKSGWYARRFPDWKDWIEELFVTFADSLV